MSTRQALGALSSTAAAAAAAAANPTVSGTKGTSSGSTRIPRPRSRLRMPSKVELDPAVSKPKQQSTHRRKRSSAENVAPETTQHAERGQPKRRAGHARKTSNPGRGRRPVVAKTKTAKHTSTAATRGMKRSASQRTMQAARARPVKRAAKTSRRSSRQEKPEADEVSPLKAEVAELNEANEDLEGRVQELEADIVQRQAQLETKTADYQRLFKEFEAKTMNLKVSEARIEDLSGKLSASEQTVVELRAEVEVKKGELAQSKRDCDALRTELEEMTAQAGQLRRDLNASRESGVQKSATIAELRAQVEALETQARQEEQMRRKLHNQVQELKGNIRVYTRVRPLLGDEAAEEPTDEDGSPLRVFSFQENTDRKGMQLSGTPQASVDGRRSQSKSWDFEFDRAFRPDESQEDVFEEVSQLVQSALDGYRVCIFAYGQTGSGKTYTMEGTPENPGMIPLSVRHLFSEAERLAEKDWSYSMQAMILEIYNEEIRDLITRSNNKVAHDVKLVKGSKKKGHVEVTNMTWVPVSGMDDVQPLLDTAAKNRRVAATQSNERSSRSHCIFQLKITGHNASTGQTTEGVLNLVDLAGSERLKKSKVKGKRLEETKAINQSLTSLGNVIASLANGSRHVPYRNSKLTYLLQSCFGGDCKTLMFVNLSPRQADLQETLCSLRFGAKANEAHIGTARRQVKV